MMRRRLCVLADICRCAPDKYWVELVERTPNAEGSLAPGSTTRQFSLAQTMLRVKDPKTSIEFYTRQLGMTHVRTSHNDTFSTYFLASLPDGCTPAPPADVTGAEAKKYLVDVVYPLNIPVLELTHNHGTENDPEFKHSNGNETGRRGFGHIGFLVTDVYATHERLSAAGVDFHKTPDGGSMKGLAFAKDPDGYLIELIKRGQDGKF
jgi:lactoylglutathione lyase